MRLTSWTTRLTALAIAAGVGGTTFAGCSEEGAGLPAAPESPYVGPGDASTSACVDADGDGFGELCLKGRDCDDANAAVTTECFRCETPTEGCPCAEEGAVAECSHVSSQIGDRITCVVGDVTCAGGAWGACAPRTMRTLTLPSSRMRALAVNAVPTLCTSNPCDSRCQHFPGDPPDGGLSLVLEGGASDGAVADAISDAAPDVLVPSSCGTQTASATRSPLGMVLMVDRSGSMNTDLGGTPAWNRVRDALTTFVGDPSTDGIYAGLDFFPEQNTAYDACSQPTVADRVCCAPHYMGTTGNYMTQGLAALPGAANAHRLAITGSLGTITMGGATPMYPALQAALLETKTWALADPTRKGVVVLVTDGLPTECSTMCEGKASKKSKQQLISCRVQEVAQTAEDYFYGTPSIETFVVGVQTNDANVRFLSAIARAGSGGRRDATIIDANSGSATGDLVEALNGIRDQSLSCEFDVPLPPTGSIDPGSTEVTVTSGAGVPTTVAKVDTLGACGTADGFYYDTDGPKVALCPNTCTTVKSDLAADLDITYECRDACTSAATEGEQGPLDMYVMLDRSGSMNTAVLADTDGDGAADDDTGTTLWQSAIAALRNFSRSPEADGMGLALGYFPAPWRCASTRRRECIFCAEKNVPFPFNNRPHQAGGYYGPLCGNATGRPGTVVDTNADSIPDTTIYKYFTGDAETCVPSSYTDPALTGGIDYGLLPGHSVNLFASLDRVIPEGCTPTAPALTGAIAAATTRALSNPTRKQVVVLVTDGVPYAASTCNGSIATNYVGCADTTVGPAVTAATTGYAAGIETYVIGLGNDTSGLTNINQIAQAGSNNTYNAFMVTAGNPSGFIDAMNTIRRRAMNCTFAVPTPPPGGTLDIASPQVLLTSGTLAVETNLTKVADQTACGTATGWYYDDNTTPAAINLCDSACDIVRNDLNSRMDILYQCVQPPPPPPPPPPPVPTLTAKTFDFEYDGAGVCNASESIIWTDWSWVASTPSDTRITFEVQVGDRDSAGVITNLSATVPLQFTAQGAGGSGADVIGKPACASLPSVCDLTTLTDTQSGGPLASLPGNVFIDQTLALAGLPRSPNYIKISATLHPNTGATVAPTLSDWDLQVSCGDAR